MCETRLKLQVVLIVLCMAFKGLQAVDDSLLFTVTRAPRYFGILQDHRGQPLSVEVSEEYMDQDYIATNKKRHKIDWNKNPLEMDDFDDDDTEEVQDDKDKDVKIPNKYNLQAALLFTVTRAPGYFGILQDHRGQPLSVEVSEEYMDQDYIATNKKRHKIDWNKNPLEMDDFDDDDTEEVQDDKDKDVKIPNKYNLQAGPV